jgi:hypothetical protein
MTRNFRTTLFLDDAVVHQAAGLALPASVKRLEPPVDVVASNGALVLRPLIRYLRAARVGNGRLLALTSRDLVTPETGSLIGSADRRAQVVIVSTARLIDPADPAALGRRLHNEISHELGHLQGLAHCERPGCLMHPVEAAADIDRRQTAPCGSCPRAWWRSSFSPARTFAAAVLLAGVLAADRAASWLVAAPEFPFTCLIVNTPGQAVQEGAGPEDRAAIQFDGFEIFALRDPGRHMSILDRSRPAIGRLNHLWRSGDPLELRVAPAGMGRARLEGNGTVIVEVLAGDTGGTDPLAVGVAWARAIANAFEARGKRVASVHAAGHP